jgi:aminomethyltransferase
MAAELLGTLTNADLEALGYYHATRDVVAGIDCLIARTGYTGEDGFELFCPVERTVELWDVVLAGAERLGGRACGLGSRDTLRLEAGMPLYGIELDRDHNPYEVNYGRLVKLDKPSFAGREALAAIAETGPRRRLVGLQMTDNAVPRHGYPVQTDAGAGVVTSGTVSPTFGTRIAMAYVPASAAGVGRQVEVVVREQPYGAEQVKLPFYRRST